MLARSFPLGDDGAIQPRDVQMTADAGFDVIVQIHGADDPAVIDRNVALADEAGLGSMFKMLGWTLAGTSGEQIVWQNGVLQDVARPFSDVLWEQTMGPAILAQAERSRTTGAVGVFLDYELSMADNQQMVQGFTFDDRTLDEFGAHAGGKVPHLAETKRCEWFRAEGPLDDFHAWQRDRCRHQVRKLRAQIDAINPRFQFAIYPGVNEPFLDIICEELATPEAPVILTPADTYGRANHFLTDDQSLESTRVWCRRAMQRSRMQYKFPHLVFGGVMPGHMNADPAFTAKNAWTLTTEADGYWVWFEAVSPGTAIETFMAFFAAANLAAHHGDDGWLGLIPPTVTEASQAHCEADPPVTVGTSVYLADGQAPRPFRILEGRPDHKQIESYTPANLKRHRVVILQNFNVSTDEASPLNETLRRYVAGGGGLMLTHDTSFFMTSPFPKIVESHLFQPPRWHHVENGRMRFTCGQNHPIQSGFEPGAPFNSRFTDYLPLKAGPEGTVLVENDEGQAIYVSGTHGAGRVLFVGSIFWYLFDEGPYDWIEDRLFLRCVQWLKGED
jgi:hypothetical protein